MTALHDDPTAGSGRTLARGLGLFSLGLGLWQLLAPDDLADRTGLDRTGDTRTALRAIGVRELAVVPSLLLRDAPSGALAARIAGDAMDLALLKTALDGKRGDERRLTASAAAAVAGVALLDLVAFARNRRRSRAISFTAAVTVNKQPEETYRFWRDLENLPRFMTHLQEVRRSGGGRSHWTAEAPVGTISWDAEIVEDVPGTVLSWRSVGRTTVPNSGAVRFTRTPTGRGTEVRVELHYSLPGGKAGAAVARLLGENPRQQVEDDLRRFKQVLETGEVVRSDGSPDGTRAGRQTLQRPAHPVANR